MVIDIRLDVKSLAATIFLAASIYMMYSAGQPLAFNAILAAMFIMAIVVGLYFSYRLFVIVYETN